MKRVLKRGFDIVFSLFLIILLLPLLLIIALLVYFKLGSPIFFTQPRPGLNGRPFKMYKF
ncbi:MAG: sugar transferase, partial [Bacteroidales bacterium]|nr:sugar transferase [Bacteroidales bacterium]